MTDFTVVRSLLRAELDFASRRYEQAKAGLKQTSAAGLVGAPETLEQASTAHSVAAESFSDALARMNAFLIEGTVPEDLRKRATTSRL